MAKRIQDIRKERDLRDSCQTCHKKIKIGDKVVTKKVSRSGLGVIHHESCAKKVELI